MLFDFSIENVVYRPKGENLPPIRLFFDSWGKEYGFDIDISREHVMETLRISYYNESVFPGATVVLKDAYHDGNITSICIYDRVNNTDLMIDKNKDGTITYDEHLIDENGARALLDTYTTEYKGFRQEADIAAKIKEYSPRIQIIEIDPRTVDTTPVHSESGIIRIGPGSSNDPAVLKQIDIDPYNQSISIIENQRKNGGPSRI
jgi:hypothetical protein